MKEELMAAAAPPSASEVNGTVEAAGTVGKCKTSVFSAFNFRTGLR